MKESSKYIKRQKRHRRIRFKVKGTSQCPRLSVFRSNKYIYLQLIDDQKGETLVAVNDQEIKPEKVASSATHRKGEKIKDKLSPKKAVAFEAGRLLAEVALKKKIKKIIFDRGGYRYHGRIKAVAEGAREGGLEF